MTADLYTFPNGRSAGGDRRGAGAACTAPAASDVCLASRPTVEGLLGLIRTYATKFDEHPTCRRPAALGLLRLSFFLALLVLGPKKTWAAVHSAWDATVLWDLSGDPPGAA